MKKIKANFSLIISFKYIGLNYYYYCRN